MKQATNPEPLAFDVNFAAKMVGIGRTLLYNEIKAGRLRAVKSGGRTLIRRADLEAYMASLPPMEPAKGAA